MSTRVGISLGVTFVAVISYIVFMDVSLDICPKDHNKMQVNQSQKLTNSGEVSDEDKSTEEQDIIPRQYQYLMNAVEEAQRSKEAAIKFTKLPVINSFNITYTLSQGSRCERSKPRIIIVVPSARYNFITRQVFRFRELGKYAKGNATILLLFFVGTSSGASFNPESEASLEKEMKDYYDIVVADFEDTYSNILLKHISMLNWITRYCAEARLAMRFDDDISLHWGIERAIKNLERHARKRDNFILGTQRVGDEPWRDRHMPQWFVSEEEYPEDEFPPYVLGGSVGYPVSTVKLLLEAARRIKTLWLDDVFITGICARALNIPNFNDIGFRFKHKGEYAQ